MKIQHFNGAWAFNGPAGPLECIGETPAEDHGTAMGLICHPHPLFQGTMHNKVVTTVARALLQCGMPVVRFNFRGVGKSAGVHDEGRGETTDTIAIAQTLLSEFPQRKLFLCGFSFGGAVAIQAAMNLPVSQLILVAPSMRCLTESPTLTCPIIIAQGEKDEIIDPNPVYLFAETHRAILLRFPGVGHFFHGTLTQLKERLINAIT